MSTQYIFIAAAENCSSHLSITLNIFPIIMYVQCSMLTLVPIQQGIGSRILCDTQILDTQVLYINSTVSGICKYRRLSVYLTEKIFVWHSMVWMQHYLSNQTFTSELLGCFFFSSPQYRQCYSEHLHFFCIFIQGGMWENQV